MMLMVLFCYQSLAQRLTSIAVWVPPQSVASAQAPHADKNNLVCVPTYSVGKLSGEGVTSLQ